MLFGDLTEHWYFPGPLGAGGEGRLAVCLGDEGGPPGVRVPRAAHTQHHQMSPSGVWNMDSGHTSHPRHKQHEGWTFEMIK